MPISTLTSKGQVTIPKEVRDRLGLKEGDQLVFRVGEDGRLLVQPAQPSVLGRLSGLLAHLAKERPVTVDEMHAAVRQRAVERYRRATKR